MTAPAAPTETRDDTDGHGRESERSRTTHAGLDADDVVEAALALVEGEGGDALTMRRLASELGVTTTTIYWHVGNRDELLVVDKWLVIQATSRHGDTLERVRALTGHEAYNPRNPNKVRSLIGAFAAGHPPRFHAADGAGYRFIADQVIGIDAFNPQVAARLALAFLDWRRYEPDRRRLIRAELERIGAADSLSGDVYEIVSKGLAEDEDVAS